MHFVLLVWCGVYANHQKRSCVFITPLGKIKTPVLKAKQKSCSLLFSLLKTAASFQPFLLIRLHTWMGKKLIRLCLLANPQQAEESKILFLWRTRCMRTGLSSTFFTGWGYMLRRRVCYSCQTTITVIPCRQASRRQAVKLLDLFLSLTEQGFYLLQRKWKERLASSLAWPHTEAGVSPVLLLKYQIETVESCRVSDLSLENELSTTQLCRD